MLVHSASALPFWKSVRPQPPIRRVSPVKTRSRHRYETLPGVCPGVAIVRISSWPKRITSPSLSRRGEPCALQFLQTEVCRDCNAQCYDPPLHGGDADLFRLVEPTSELQSTCNLGFRLLLV